VKVHQKSKVVLVTTTCSQSVNEMRAKLAIKTCWAARDNGYKIIVVDNSPSLDFKEALREAEAEVIDQKLPGMGQSRRECIYAGLNTEAEIIVWLEPEKYTLVPLLEPCIYPVLCGEASVVIPRRRNLDSYPQYQQWSEYAGNWSLGNITGRPDLDFYNGPRVMSRNTASILMSYNANFLSKHSYGDNWEILFIPILWLLKCGPVVKSVTVDYIHPIEQLVEDDEIMRAKRDKQRRDLISTVALEAKRLGIKGL
jgi:hypothetical protein